MFADLWKQYAPEPVRTAGTVGYGMADTGITALKNFMDANYQPGLRREDVTDIPAQGGWARSFGSQPNDPAVGASADVAANLMGTGTGFAQPGAAGIFGGKLAKTADLNALARAEQMTAKGT